MTQWGLDTLFNPAKRHMDEEKRRLQATREEAGDSSGGKRIDLESGKVKIRRGGAKPTAGTDAAAEADDVADAELDADAEAEADPDTESGESDGAARA